MRSEVLFVKSLEDYLYNVVKPILLHPNSLRSGKTFKNIKLRPREVLGAFLICITIRHISGQDWTIAKDPELGDGVILCRDQGRQNEGAFLEQVYVRLRPSGFGIVAITERINAEIRKKVDKGQQYALNRHLVIFLDVEGLLDHQKVKQYVDRIQERFDSYWLFAPYSKNSEYKYIVFLLRAKKDQSSAYEILIDNSFRGWNVKKIGHL